MFKNADRARHLFYLLFISLSGKALPLHADPAAYGADTILVGGRIYTMDPQEPRVEALAIRSGTIVARGSAQALARWQGPATQRLDLKGQAVYPGFHEGHGHLLGLGWKLQRLDLAGISDKKTVLARIESQSRKTAKDTWLVGRGWDQNLWQKASFPSRTDLDALAPNIPMALTRIDGHALWVNSIALQKAGISRHTPDPQGGQILRDARGEPTGILLDRATELIATQIPPPSAAQMAAALQLAVQSCLAQGITTFHDAGVSSSTLNLYEKMHAASQLPLRINALLDGSDPEQLARYLPRGPQRDPWLMIVGVKLMADGALGSRGAALLEPYSDLPSSHGLEILTEEAIYALSKRFAQAGFQTATHAIGDRSNRSVLNAYEKVLKDKEFATKDLRLRVEHAQILDAQDIARFGALGVIASMQPTHLTSDAPWVPQRIGQARMDEGAYVWQKLKKSQARLVGGSDVPVESGNPLWGLYAAVSRRDHKGQPPTGWAFDQHLSLYEALEMYTRNAAYAAFAEQSTGSLEIGKQADLVVLQDDLFEKEAEPQKILGNHVEMTMIAGRVVYRRSVSGDGPH